MTAVPLLVLLFFAVIIAGGPEDLLKFMERSLEKVVSWVADLAS